MGLVKEAEPGGLEDEGTLLLVCLVLPPCTWGQVLPSPWKEALKLGLGPS